MEFQQKLKRKRHLPQYRSQYRSQYRKNNGLRVQEKRQGRGAERKVTGYETRIKSWKKSMHKKMEKV